MKKSGYLNTGLPGPKELIFLPLGGCNEIGMNLNLYGHDGKWIIVDFGVSFGDDTIPGVDVIMPDPSFIEERKGDLLGIVLTHAHEDHLGAIPYLWEDLECPIYATPFTASFLKRKLDESSFKARVPIHVLPLDSRFKLGSFDLEYICLNHSIPEPTGLMIRTKAGNIFHTGDWKIDPDPIVGKVIEEDRLIALRKEGVRAMLCDSTNALSAGHSASEGDVAVALKSVIGQLKGKVAVGCFASNIARLRSIAEAGLAHGRKSALIGRSLWRMQDTAREHGYLDGIPPFLNEKDLKNMKDDEILLICTGSQGEPRAALARIARNDHPLVKLGKGDTVLFSSREIPGNDVSIARLQNGLASLGVEVITAEEYPIHASGHPCRDELVQMYDWIRPEILVPVHGEARHLIAQAKLGEESQIPHCFISANGRMIDLGGDGPPKVLDEVFSSRLALSGDDLLPLDHESIRARRKLSENGVVMVTVIGGRGNKITQPPHISVVGLPEPTADDLNDLNHIIYQACESYASPKSSKRKKGFDHFDDSDQRKRNQQILDSSLPLEEIISITVRRYFLKLTGKRPAVVVHIL